MFAQVKHYIFEATAAASAAGLKAAAAAETAAEEVSRSSGHITKFLCSYSHLDVKMQLKIAKLETYSNENTRIW